jgi:hypothetical protein
MFPQWVGKNDPSAFEDKGIRFLRKV